MVAWLILAGLLGGVAVIVASFLMPKMHNDQKVPLSAYVPLLGALVFIIGLTSILYAWGGSPHLPGQPIAQRKSEALRTATSEDLLVTLRQALNKRPDDSHGWRLLARSALQMGRFDDAEQAFARLLVLEGRTPALLASLAEAKILGASRTVTPETEALLQEVVQLDPDHPKAHFYLGLAEVQDGRLKAAQIRWTALEKRAEQDAPWLPLLKKERIRLEEKLQNPQTQPPRTPTPEKLKP